MLVQDLHVRVINAATGELLGEGLGERRGCLAPSPPVPTGLVSKSVSRRTLWPATFWILRMRRSQGTVLQIMTAMTSRLRITCVNTVSRTFGYACVPHMSRAAAPAALMVRPYGMPAHPVGHGYWGGYRFF
jgi:hypothetical protein